MRYVKFGVLALVAILIAGFLHYTLPRQHVVQITGTDTQRVDTAGSWFYAGSEGTNADGNRDVKFIRTVTDGGQTKVFRNEDTGWGWPPYFKLDSQNVQGDADRYAKDGDIWVVVKSYGWRSTLLSIFPNAVKITPTSGPADKPLPIGNVIILLCLAGGAYGVYYALGRFWNRRVDPMIDRVSDVFDRDNDGTDKP